MAAAEGRTDEAAVRLNDLLLPIVKGYGSERSWVLLGTESLQTFGGSGFLADYPLEQYVRDAKIDTLYEGTTAIQGQDLFFRKIVKDQGRALTDLSTQIGALIASEAGNGQLKEERDLLEQGLENVGELVATMITTLQSSAPQAPEGDVRNVYKVGLNTTRLLMALGDVICAWLLLRGAEVALSRLGGELSAADKAFYEGKVASARWFTRTVLPKLAAEVQIAEATDLAVMDLAGSRLLTRRGGSPHAGCGGGAQWRHDPRRDPHPALRPHRPRQHPRPVRRRRPGRRQPGAGRPDDGAGAVVRDQPHRHRPLLR